MAVPKASLDPGAILPRVTLRLRPWINCESPQQNTGNCFGYYGRN